ncbi:Arginine decarboxylase [Tupaia chinensis]|uniref:Arginine decarboxylase n=1 Tax=Tupaia chinensis TaxID=246437 RepID=L9JHQ4_TUPCH|nr:Arginine decarboxylase [Tupaia chinensis]
MAGYLSESDFVMVEEGFSVRDLLEELALGSSQATTGPGAAFFVADLGVVVRRHFSLLQCLPRVRPFYAVKCNSSLGVLKVLAELGLGFRCASKAEMELVQRIGVPASKIIYTNPCKQIAQVRYAAQRGIQLLSFDNEVELAKVVRSHPNAKMVLCIAPTDSHSPSQLSLQFGASLTSCRRLLEHAKESHVEVVGVSFRVDSGCPDPQAYTRSIADARLVFEMGAELGHRMHVLDLGGGFPALEGTKARLEEIAAVISSALDLYFPEGCGVDILAELGRYYVASAFTVAVSVVAKQEVLLGQPGRDEENGSAPKTFMYHLHEGVYGIFNSVLFDNACPTPVLQKLHVGDWLVFDNMGAYTMGTGSLPGGTRAHRVTYAMSRVAWEALRGQLLPAEQDEDAEGACKPLSCGWEITDTLCVGPAFTPASIIDSSWHELDSFLTELLVFPFHLLQECETDFSEMRNALPPPSVLPSTSSKVEREVLTERQQLCTAGPAPPATIPHTPEHAYLRNISQAPQSSAYTQHVPPGFVFPICEPQVFLRLASGDPQTEHPHPAPARSSAPRSGGAADSEAFR